MNKMTRTTTLLVLACIHIHGLTFAANKQEVNIETNTDDPYVTKMYAKEIADGDNAELPLEKAHHKHHKGNKKHFHGVLHNGYHGGFHGGYHGGLHHHVPIGLPINDGLGIPYGHGLPHYDLNHVGHIPHHHHIRIGHVPESPIIHLQNHHHGMHHAHFPEYMPLPYTLPMCVIEKDDDKKKDDKKKDDKKEKGKKSKRQLVPCHYYGPPGAGWGAYVPGWTGGGWGAPYWY